MAGAKKGNGGAKSRSQILWTRDELLRLLHAWRDTLLQLRRDPPAVNGECDEDEDEDVNALAFERFLELSSGWVDAPERHETPATRKMYALLRIFRHSQEYNQQQEQVQDNQASSSQRTKRKNRKKQPMQQRQNHWLALTLEQQTQSFQRRYPSAQYIEIDQEMFTVLAVVEREMKRHKSRTDALRSRTNVLWTKGEVWVLINAWRQVVESRPKTHNRNVYIAMLVYNQFVALSQEGMPKRSKYAVKGKLQALIKLYRVVSEFNRRRSSNGPHGDRGDFSSDWFASPPHVQAQYVANLNQRVANLSDLDQDTFNAMEMIMKYEDSLQAMTANSNSHKEHGQRGHSGHNIIDILSDTESFGIGSDESDWEILPANPSVLARSRTPSFESARLVNAGSWSASRHPVELGEAVHHQLQASMVNAASRTGILEAPGAFDVSEGETTGGARKRVKTHSDQLSAAQVQNVLEMLAKLKKDRKADKAKRREEREERKELLQLIAQEREEREKDREERRKERQEWVLERDKLKFKLKKMRERYKRATRKLKGSSG